MKDLYIIISISFIHFLALVSPGPDFIIVMKNSIQYSRKAGIYTSIGISLGILIHLFYCITGLSLILSTNLYILNLFKFLCAGYLSYLGIKSIQSNAISKNNQSIHKMDISYLKAIKIGFFTNVLNPKVSLFFLSLFSFIIVPEQLPVEVIIFLIIIITISSFIWFSTVSIFISQKKVNIFFSKYFHFLNKIFGIILIFLALGILKEISF